MATITIDLPDQQAAELSEQASAQGLTLEAWIQAAASTMDWSQCPAVESVPGRMSGHHGVVPWARQGAGARGDRVRGAQLGQAA